MGRIDLPYVNSYQDRHGKWRFYYRRGKTRIRLPKDPTAPEFLTEYQRIHAMFEKGDSDFPAFGTFGYLVTMYYSAAEFKQLKEKTKKDYCRYLDAARSKFDEIPLHGMTRRVIKTYRDTMCETPVAANHALRVLRLLFSFAINNDLLKENPTKGIKMLKSNSDGWKPWDAETLKIFADQSRGAARIAFYLALYTGQRRGDILKMRWDSITNNGIQLVQGKTGKALWVPIHPILAEEIDAFRISYAGRAADRSKNNLPASFGLTIVQKENGAPYAEEGFASIWDREQKRLGCTGQFHGLRKNATINLFEAGCTPQQVQSITGHSTLEMVEHYGKGASQKRLAEEAMRMVLGKDEGK